MHRVWITTHVFKNVSKRPIRLREKSVYLMPDPPRAVFEVNEPPVTSSVELVLSTLMAPPPPVALLLSKSHVVNVVVEVLPIHTAPPLPPLLLLNVHEVKSTVELSILTAPPDEAPAAPSTIVQFATVIEELRT